MKTTLDIPDELYRQAEVRAAQQGRTVDDLVGDGLRLVLGFLQTTETPKRRRMIEAPVSIREGNVIPALTNDTLAELLESSGERLP